MIRKAIPAVFVSLIVIFLVVRDRFLADKGMFTASEKEIIFALSPPAAVPQPVDPATLARISLGKLLFFDKSLSRNQDIACASCHDPAKSWTDGRKTGVGLDTLNRNTLSLWNVHSNRWFYWDGRADSPWSQALKPMEAPNEMGGNRLAVFRRIRFDENYAAWYEQAFGERPGFPGDEQLPLGGCPCPDDPGLSQAWSRLDSSRQSHINAVFANVGKSIQAFESTIVSDSSRFDWFVTGLRTGDAEALTALGPAEIRGLKLFIRARCVVCHHGPDFTDQEFHDIRLPATGTPPDPGRIAGIARLLQDPFNANSAFADSTRDNFTRFVNPDAHLPGQFKTPTLRNVTRTAPYMHDGRFASLEEVLSHYNTLSGASPQQKGETVIKPLFLQDAEIADLLQFLHALEDESMVTSFR